MKKIINLFLVTFSFIIFLIFNPAINAQTNGGYLPSLLSYNSKDSVKQTDNNMVDYSKNEDVFDNERISVEINGFGGYASISTEEYPYNKKMKRNAMDMGFSFAMSFNSDNIWLVGYSFDWFINVKENDEQYYNIMHNSLLLKVYFLGRKNLMTPYFQFGFGLHHTDRNEFGGSLAFNLGLDYKIFKYTYLNFNLNYTGFSSPFYLGADALDEPNKFIGAFMCHAGVIFKL